ncbi:DNA mismatch repair enzyme (predicted ATPase) [Ceratocystis platani]|uniref:DNA mismatch repair enzyme (Predicted ATPase) n=1 Tax=Ceratocystis fimbriata f. sp. platani TaxID=88771 RepID=A0A0F8B433_CERFI|nr:DNA mismatch repair enzyme (predicted ATPase) [Ceratocystis platani]
MNSPAAIKTGSSIRPIPSTAVAQIRSSAQLTSLNEVIVGLTQNALDAEASRIRITLDYVLGNCVVEDNGNGILPTEFASSGGLGKAHRKSEDDTRTKAAYTMATETSLHIVS